MQACARVTRKKEGKCTHVHAHVHTNTYANTYVYTFAHKHILSQATTEQNM